VKVCTGAEAIVDYAEQKDVHQIIMATHGYAGITRWTHGSVAERVCQSANAPVLLVRAQEGEVNDLLEPTSCGRILVPLDGSSVAEQVLPSVMSMARALGAEIILFQVPVVPSFLNLRCLTLHSSSRPPSLTSEAGNWNTKGEGGNDDRRTFKR
jgi:nucleotide-binding universal stress UspA family protein